METARARLRFSAAKPAAPSMLGSLLSSPMSTVQYAPAPEQNPTAEAASLEPETGISFDADFLSDSPAAGRKVFATDDPNEDFSLLDISDEELGTLIVEHDQFGKAKSEDSPPLSEAHDFASNDFTPSDPLDTSAELELDLGDLVETKEGEIDPGALFQGEPEKLDPATVSQAQAGFNDDFLIDFSEGELDNFLKQLDQTTDRKS